MKPYEIVNQIEKGDILTEEQAEMWLKHPDPAVRGAVVESLIDNENKAPALLILARHQRVETEPSILQVLRDYFFR